MVLTLLTLFLRPGRRLKGPGVRPSNLRSFWGFTPPPSRLRPGRGGGCRGSEHHCPVEGLPPLPRLAPQLDCGCMRRFSQCQVEVAGLYAAELKGPRKLLRIQPEIFDFEPEVALQQSHTKPKYPARCPQTGTQSFRTVLAPCRCFSTTIRNF